MIDQQSSISEIQIERLRRRRHSFRRLILANLRDLSGLLHEAWVPLLGFLLVLATGTLYLVLFYRDPSQNCGGIGDPCYGLFPALYETFHMLVLESETPLPTDLIGRVLFFTIPLLGLAFIFQSVIDFGRLLLDKGNRREAWQVSLASTFHDHVIVCGLGRVSYRVMIQLLEAGYDVVVVEQDWTTEFVSDALKLRVPVVLGDAHDFDTLKQAGLLHARGLVAGINNDLINLEIALTARRKRPDLNIVMRIFSDELDTNLERSFGRNSAFSSSALAASTLTAAAVSRDIVQVVPLSDGLLGISELEIVEGSEFSGFVQTVEDHFDVRIVRHVSPEGRERPASLTATLEGGDRVLMMGMLDALEYARECNQRSKFDFLNPANPALLQHPTAQRDTIIVFGLGRVGYRVVKELRRLYPRLDLVVIHNETTSKPFLEEIHALGVRTLLADPPHFEVLHTAGIERAFSVAAVTSDSLANIHVGLAARRMRGDVHLVLRVFNDVLAEQLNVLFGERAVFSTSALAAPTLAATAVVRGIDHAINIGKHLFSTVMLTVQPGDEFMGQTVWQIREQAHVLVATVRRNGAYIVPLKLDTHLEVGDEIVVLVDIARLARLRSRHARTGEATTRRLVASEVGD